jgi:transposase
MGKPYSDDLRARVAASVVDGRTCRATATLFDVSVASAVKWSQRLRQTGSAAAKPMGGVRRAVLAGEREWLLARITAAPDLTLRALAGELADRGVVVSHWAVWKFCVNEGLSFKKKPSAQRAGSRRCRLSTRSLA